MSLTPREALAVRMLREGKPRKEIAKTMRISPQHLGVLFSNARAKGEDVPRGEGGRPCLRPDLRAKARAMVEGGATVAAAARAANVHHATVWTWMQQETRPAPYHPLHDNPRLQRILGGTP